jgi:cell division protein DivIC
VDATGYGDFRARREATIWQRMNHVLRVLLFVTVWLLVISFFLPPYKQLIRNRAETDQLLAQLTEEKLLLARQARTVSLLKSDPTYLETIARDKLDLMKEGETIFRLETRRAGSALPAQP